jgi:hypothetical protein
LIEIGFAPMPFSAALRSSITAAAVVLDVSPRPPMLRRSVLTGLRGVGGVLRARIAIAKVVGLFGLAGGVAVLVGALLELSLLVAGLVVSSRSLLIFARCRSASLPLSSEASLPLRRLSRHPSIEAVADVVDRLGEAFEFPADPGEVGCDVGDLLEPAEDS